MHVTSACVLLFLASGNTGIYSLIALKASVLTSKNPCVALKVQQWLQRKQVNGE